ncbi:MAG: BTAD domain-containing putative transcriptional regulator [Jatrophihabitans sp.]
MQVAMLGPLEVSDDAGRPVALAGARLRSLLCRLACEAGLPVATASLVEAVWGEQPPAEAANALQTLVSRLRRALGPAALIVQSPAGYRLAAASEAVDAHRFERLAAEGSQALAAGDPAGASSTLGQALALWRGPVATELSEPVAQRWADLRLAALLDRVDADLRLGRAPAVLSELEALALQHPLDERLAGQLMTALTTSGRQADALRAFERVRAGLAEELGVDPSAELRAVQLAVLRGEISTPATGRRSNLRAQLTSFIGRDEEVARIAKALQESRLVTLVGPGGAGKTRLANEAAATIVEFSPDGIWLVELASVTDVADLPQTVLASLGIREAHLLDRRGQLSARDTLTRLQDSLADKNAVLILDNCEHLVEASARLADQLLGHCPQLRVLTTSREPLGIFGEVLLVVPPLGQPELSASARQAAEHPAVQLFVDRARAVRPGFVLDEDTVALVVDIVRRLDGLPLAIELAAARLRSLPLTDVANRLSDRFRLLTGGSRTAMPRHRTLRAVVEWSWELLEDAERSLAERLAVFPAGATNASAAAVCADEPAPADEVADLLACLVDKSLLQPVAGGGRLRMLETIREYGLERLAERGELAALRVRHADYFADLLDRAEPHLVSADQLPWFDLLTAERDNILAAMRFRCDAGDADGALRIAVSVGGFAMLLGNHAEVPIWLSEALAVPGGSDSELRWIGEALYAMNAATTGSGAEALAASLTRLRAIGDNLDGIDLDRHPLTGLLRAAVAYFSDDHQRAARYVAEALACNNEWVRAAVLMFRGGMSENQGDVGATRADTTAALSEFRRIGERWGTASALRAMAQLLTLDGELDHALAAYDEALRLMVEMKSSDDEAFLRTRMADLCLRRGDPDAARVQLRLAQASNEVTGSAIEAVFTLCMRAEVERQAGNLVAARALHEQAVGRLTSVPAAHPVQSHSTVFVHALSGRLALCDGDLAGATEQLRVAFDAAVGTRDRPVIASVGVIIADLAETTGDPARAAALLGAAAGLRGAEDRTACDIARLFSTLQAGLGQPAFDAAYQRGRQLDHDAALALIEPS